MNNISNQYGAGHQYESVTNTAKELKAKKEAGGTAFGAQVLAQSLNLEMVQQATQILQVNTQNFSGTTPLNSNLQTNINQVKFTPNTYGYSIDSEGFMGSDFNKAAGLPENFKIHKSTLDEIYDYNERSYIHKPTYNTKTFENIDMADTVKQYYKLFQNVVGSDDKQIYTRDDLSKLPKGFSFNSTKLTDNGNYLPDVDSYKVTNIYRNSQQIENAKDLAKELSSLQVNFNAYQLDFSMRGLAKDNGGGLKFNPNMSMYKTQDGYTNAGVFVGFLKSFAPKASDSGETKLTDQVATYSVWNMEQGRKDIEFIKRTNGGASDIHLERMMQEEITIAELLRNPSDDSSKSIDMKTIKERVKALLAQTAV